MYCIWYYCATIDLCSMTELSLIIQRDLEWRPGRTVILCSWDAEEYGLIGSYEWVEVRADSTKTHQLCSNHYS